jgi:hypothetical protein
VLGIVSKVHGELSGGTQRREPDGMRVFTLSCAVVRRESELSHLPNWQATACRQIEARYCRASTDRRRAASFDPKVSAFWYQARAFSTSAAIPTTPSLASTVGS